MKPRAVRCVVFDIDDTLYLERDYVRSGFDAVGRWAASELGLRDLGARAWAEFEAGARGDIFDRVLIGVGAPATGDVVQRMVQVYRGHAPDIALLGDARACLDGLAGRAALACVSDGPLLAQRSKANALGLARWLDPIVLTAELGEGFAKPHRRAFEIIEAERRTGGEACAYVADNPAKDFAAPAALGWLTVRVTRPGALHERATSGRDVSVEVRDLSSLDRILGLPR